MPTAHTINYLVREETGSSLANCKSGSANSIEVGVHRTVPIILVPGVMASKLERAADGELVWNPDSLPDMMRYMTWSGKPKKKKKWLVGLMNATPDLEMAGKSRTDSYLKVPNPDFLENPDNPDEPGWGNVAGKYYDAMLKFLQNALLENDETSQYLREAFDLPVYAFGYDWTADNSESGERLSQKISDIIEKHNTDKQKCEQVLLVTHSMGGLVARSACVEHGSSEEVLGVVHGFQPVTGAATSYWRMKAGFERGEGLGARLMAWALGTNGAEVTALMGNMPGVLQLLPSGSYVDNDGKEDWLNLDYKNRTHPNGHDPYNKIYMEESKWWRLITKRYLVPESDKESAIESGWRVFKAYMKKAKTFHGQDVPDDAQHPNTYHFLGVGTDHPTADDIRYRVEQIAEPPVENPSLLESITEGIENVREQVEEEAGDAKDWVTRSNYGGFVVKFDGKKGGRYKAWLQAAQDAGDGTVPVSSASALENAAGTQRCETFANVAHAEACNDANVQSYVRDALQLILTERLKEMVEAMKE